MENVFYVTFCKKTVFYTCQAWQLKLMVLKTRILKNVPFSVKDLFQESLLEKLFWLMVPVFAQHSEQRSWLCYQHGDSPKFMISQLRWHDLFSFIVDPFLKRMPPFQCLFAFFLPSGKAHRASADLTSAWSNACYVLGYSETEFAS